MEVGFFRCFYPIFIVLIVGILERLVDISGCYCGRGVHVDCHVGADLYTISDTSLRYIEVTGIAKIYRGLGAAEARAESSGGGAKEASGQLIKL